MIADDGQRHGGFTLVELLVVVSIIALLMGILLPSLMGARQQSKITHCLARLKDLGTSTVTYAEDYDGVLPPAKLSASAHPTMKAFYEDTGIYVGYAWAELLYEHTYKDRIKVFNRYPVQRNFDDRYPDFVTCNAARKQRDHAGHYRVYIPGWSHGTQGFNEFGQMTYAGSTSHPASLSQLQPRLILMGDSEEESESGDDQPYLGSPCGDACCGGPCEALECSYIGEHTCPCSSDPPPTVTANQPDSQAQPGFTPNRFSDRHRGGTNYLFGDFHAEHSTSLRKRLACDPNLDGICDMVSDRQREFAGCGD